MSAVADRPESKKPHKRRALIAAFAGFCILVTLAVVVMLLAQRSGMSKQGRAEIDRRIGAIRTKGEPVTSADLARVFPAPPPERDALKLLEPVFQLLVVPDGAASLPLIGDGQLPSRSGPLEHSFHTNLTEFARVNTSALRIFPDTSLTNAVFPSQVTRGFDEGLPASRRLIFRLANTLLLQALSEFEDRQNGDAVHALTRCLHISRAMRSDTLLHHLMRRRTEERACSIVERGLNHAALADQELVSLIEGLADDNLGGFHNVLISHRCLEIWQFEQVRAAPIKSTLGAVRDLRDSEVMAAIKGLLFGTIAHLRGWVYQDSDFLACLERRAGQLEALKLPVRQRLAELDKLSGERDSPARPTLAAMIEGGRNWPHERARDDVEVLAKKLVTRTALVVERWRLAHPGRTPKSLAELVPNYLPMVPNDPFDEQPLRYRSLPSGFIIYAIGADLTDNGGKEKPNGADTSKHHDLTFTIER